MRSTTAALAALDFRRVGCLSYPAGSLALHDPTDPASTWTECPYSRLPNNRTSTRQPTRRYLSKLMPLLRSANGVMSHAGGPSPAGGMRIVEIWEFEADSHRLPRLILGEFELGRHRHLPEARTATTRGQATS